MKPKLQEIRKARGFKSAKAFAEHIGMSVRTYTNYEQGVTSLSLEKAWEFADILDCTLDEIAGRKRRSRSFADPRQEELMGHYESLNDKSKTDLVGFAKSFAADPERRMVKDEREDSGDTEALGA